MHKPVNSLYSILLILLFFALNTSAADMSVSPRIVSTGSKIRITVNDLPLPQGASVSLAGSVGTQRFKIDKKLERPQKSVSTSIRCKQLSAALKINVSATISVNGNEPVTIESYVLNEDAIKQRFAQISKKAQNGMYAQQYPLLAPGTRPLQAASMLVYEKLTLLSKYSRTKTIVRILEKYDELQKFQTEQDYTKHLNSLRGVQEGAYISNIDGSAQPFKYYVPQKDAPESGYPLLILLHGYVPSYNKLSWCDIDEELAAMAEELGCVLLLPFGRGNTDYLTIGEVDVFDSIDALNAITKLDRKRVYLSGYSMGGSGVWTLLCHYPDKFAAARIWQGRTDYFLWYEEKHAALGLSRENYPPYKKALLLADNPLDLHENILNIPVRVSHPADDNLVKPAQTSIMIDTLARAGHKNFKQLPAHSGLQHWFFTSEIGKPESYRWMLQHTIPDNPRRITFNTFTPYYSGAWWLKSGIPQKWGQIMLQQAEKNGGKIKWAVQKNVSSTQPVQGKRVKYGNTTGPVKNVFAAPFICVYDLHQSSLKQQQGATDLVKWFAQDWMKFAHAMPRIKRYDELTEEDVKNFNLVLLGNPRNNSYIKKIANKLPFVMDGNKYGVKGHTVPSKGNGFFACYPNPENSAKMIVILDGLYYGEGLSFNHKWDLIPDYIVYSMSRDLEDGANTALLAGFFDSEWQFCEETNWMTFTGAKATLKEDKAGLPKERPPQGFPAVVK